MVARYNFAMYGKQHTLKPSAIRTLSVYIGI